jgi:uncharacterized cupredoxin-like copper-binding protein
MRRLIPLIPVGLLLAACGGSSNGNQGSAAGGAVVQTVQVSEKEFSLNPGTITLPKPGTYEFDVTNDGSITHAFTVEQSGGGDEAKTGDISPGSHKTVKFTFSAGGSYEMYCPVDGHKSQGMEGTISVAGAVGGGMTTNPQGETTTDAGTTTDSSPGY